MFLKFHVIVTSQTQLFSVTRELLVPSALSSPEVALNNVIPEVNLRSEPEKIYFPATNLLTYKETRRKTVEFSSRKHVQY